MQEFLAENWHWILIALLYALERGGALVGRWRSAAQLVVATLEKRYQQYPKGSPERAVLTLVKREIEGEATGPVAGAIVEALSLNGEAKHNISPWRKVARNVLKVIPLTNRPILRKLRDAWFKFKPDA